MSDDVNECVLCAGKDNLETVAVAPQDDQTVVLCDTCRAGVEGAIEDSPHWKCLSDAIWSPDAATQVLAYRLLSKLGSEVWARELLDIAYLEPETLEWAKAGLVTAEEDSVIHRDTNGARLSAGDTVVLIKDLNVKGAGFTAKRGTAVRNISLVPDNEGQIEGRVNGQQIVILTEFVKKS